MLSPTNFNDKAGRKAMRIRNRGLAPLGFLASAVCRERAYWLIITTQTGDGDSVFRVPASWLYFFISMLLGKGLTMLLLQEAQLAPELQPKDYTAFPLFSPCSFHMHRSTNTPSSKSCPFLETKGIEGKAPLPALLMQVSVCLNNYWSMALGPIPHLCKAADRRMS